MVFVWRDYCFASEDLTGMCINVLYFTTKRSLGAFIDNLIIEHVKINHLDVNILCMFVIGCLQKKIVAIC